MENSQTARRGRPPIQDGQEVANNQQKKRLRMRLAQRSYRARKREEQESESSRAEELSSALDKALAAFSTLHQHIIDTPQIRNSPDVLSHLNIAVTQMAAIASDTNKVLPLPDALEHSRPNSRQQRPGMLAPHQSATVDSGATTISLRMSTPNQIPVSARVVRACFELVVSILSSSKVSGGQAQALALPLQLLGVDGLMVNSLRSLSLFQLSVDDFQYPRHSAAQLPHMYRVIEGETKAVSRAPAPFVQRVVRGRTRTILDTDIAPLQGEWLEAADVEEYLEERGIYLRNAVSNGTASTYDTMYQSPVSDREQSISMLYPPEAMAGREITRPIDDNIPSQLRGHEPADYSVFGLPGTKRRLPSANTQLHLTAMAGVLQSEFSHQSAQVIGKASRVTVDLDKLVQLLAENATCLGPVPGIRKAAVDSSIRGSIIIS